MDINQAFPSKYLKAEDLQGKRHTVQMNYVEVEKLGDDDRPVLYFVGKKKGLPMNKTNAETVASAYGWETDAWAGKYIDIFPADVEFKGKMTKGIRLALPARQVQQAPAQYQQPSDFNTPPPHDAYPQDFAATQAPAPAPRPAPPSHIIAPARPAPAPRTTIDDDEIPF